MSKKINTSLVNCSLCNTPGTNKSSCPLNKNAKNPNLDKHDVKIQSAGAKSKGTKRKFRIDVTMETPVALGVFDLYNSNVVVPTWYKNPKPYSTINASECALNVAKWYKKVMTAKGGPFPDTGYYYLDTISKFDIKHVKNNVFEVSYELLNQQVDPETGKMEPDTIKPWEVADPDYKFLYPLECKGTKYHVYATIHGSKSKTHPRKNRSEHVLFKGPYNEAATLWK